MLAFISYHHEEREIAGRVSELFDWLNITTFMAHEDIEVSDDWRATIIQHVNGADLFVPLLSERYYQSIWCVQESGMAALRKKSLIPLSIDGSIPKGFIGHIQSTKIDPNSPQLGNILPGLARHDMRFTIDALVTYVGDSGSYRDAEDRFGLLSPYQHQATQAQMVRLLKLAGSNVQISNAGLCARSYLPPILTQYGQYLPEEIRKPLEQTLKRYAPIKANA